MSRRKMTNNDVQNTTQLSILGENYSTCTFDFENLKNLICICILLNIDIKHIIIDIVIKKNWMINRMLFQTHSFIKSQYERIEIEKKEESILNVVRKINRQAEMINYTFIWSFHISRWQGQRQTDIRDYTFIHLSLIESTLGKFIFTC
jgi:hypothetical protein